MPVWSSVCSCVLEREKEMEVMHVWVCLCVGELFDSFGRPVSGAHQCLKVKMAF